MVTSLARYTLRAAAVHDPDPVAVLRTLDTVLRQQHAVADGRFCTVLAGLLTPSGAGCSVKLAGGGHPAALLLRADGGTEFRPTPGGQLVGLLPSAHFAATTVPLGPGDTLLLYTDGPTEMRVDGDRNRFGEEALAELLAGSAPTTAHAVVEQLRTLLAGAGDRLDDDTALLALSVPAGA
jgi:phosphoserine phosphatase RsbU/P